MARIRSVHPGFWTDETMVVLSIPARLFLIGLWNECDDQGAFEWKPLALKMRLFPADNLDIAELLAELEANNVVRRYTVGERQYGAVRNFCRYQRPKKPNSVHPISRELRTYAGYCYGSSEPEDDLTSASSEPGASIYESSSEPEADKPSVAGNQWGTSSEPEPLERPPIPKKGELAVQMEEEGGKERKQAAHARARAGPRDSANGAGPSRWDDAAIVPAGPENDPKNPDRPTVNGYFLDWTFDAALDAARIDPAKAPVTWAPVVAWLKADIHPETIVAAIRSVAERPDYVPKRSLAYFDKPVREQRAA